MLPVSITERYTVTTTGALLRLLRDFQVNLSDIQVNWHANRSADFQFDKACRPQFTLTVLKLTKENFKA